MSASTSRIIRRPARIISWSSASSTRSGLIPPRRQARVHGEAATVTRPGLEAPAVHARPAPASRPARARRCAVPAGRPCNGALVDDLDLDPAAVRRSAARTRSRGAWRSALVSASWRIRNAASARPGESSSNASRSSTSSSTSRPAQRASRATSSSTRSRLAGGLVAGGVAVLAQQAEQPVHLRNGVAPDPLDVEQREAQVLLLGSEQPPRPPPAWRPITLMLWPITSWSSRAMRARSAATAAAALASRSCSSCVGTRRELVGLQPHDAHGDADEQCDRDGEGRHDKVAGVAVQREHRHPVR